MTNRKSLALWIVLGCIVFGAAGFPLAVETTFGSQAETIRGQSPDGEVTVVVSEDPAEGSSTGMTAEQIQTMILYLAIFVLAIFVGFEVITKVPPTLHTPLMSGSNAISGITLVGAMIVAGAGWGFSSWLGMFAVALAMINVVGGFLVTHRMLSMFQAKKR